MAPTQHTALTSDWSHAAVRIRVTGPKLERAGLADWLKMGPGTAENVTKK